MFRICTGSEFEAAGPATVNELSAAKRVPVRCITQLPRVIIGGGRVLSRHLLGGKVPPKPRNFPPKNFWPALIS